MLTTDLSLIADPIYREISQSFADDINVLNKVFAGVWKKLMENGGRWADNRHCIDANTIISVKQTRNPTTAPPTTNTEDLNPDGISGYSMITIWCVIIGLLQFVF